MEVEIAQKLAGIIPSFTTLSLIPAMPGLHKKIGYGSGYPQLVILEEQHSGIHRIFDYHGHKIGEFLKSEFNVYQCDDFRVIVFNDRKISPICFRSFAFKSDKTVPASVENDKIHIDGRLFQIPVE